MVRYRGHRGYQPRARPYLDLWATRLGFTGLLEKALAVNP
jgi:hypothetical protein